MKEEINLLPPTANEFRIRKLVWVKIGHLLRLSIVLLCILLVALGAAWGVIITAKKISPDNTSKTNVANLTETKQKIADANFALKIISSSAKKISPWTVLVPDLLKSAPEGIHITQLAADQTTDSLTIMGIYGSFDQVVNYKQQLEKLSWVKNVTAPLSNFTTDSSARFTISVTR